jgi:hypothetical protein
VLAEDGTREGGREKRSGRNSGGRRLWWFYTCFLYRAKTPFFAPRRGHTQTNSSYVDWPKEIASYVEVSLDRAKLVASNPTKAGRSLLVNNDIEFNYLLM